MQSIMDAGTVQKLRDTVLSAQPQGPQQGAAQGWGQKCDRGAPAPEATADAAAASQLRPIHIAAAITRLPKIMPGAGGAAAGGGLGADAGAIAADQEFHQAAIVREVQQLLLQLLDMATSQAPYFLPRQLANILWAVAKLASASGGAASPSQASQDSGGDGGDGRGLLTSARLRPYLEVLITEAVGQPVVLRAAAGKDDAREAGAPAAGNAAACKLEDASGRELANFAWAAAQLGVTAAPVWDAVVRLATAKLSDANAPRHGAHDWTGGSGGGARRGGGAYGGMRGGGAAAAFNEADLANLAWALAKVERQPGDALGEGLVVAALHRFEELGPISLAGLVWGLGTLAGLLPPTPSPSSASPAGPHTGAATTTSSHPHQSNRQPTAPSNPSNRSGAAPAAAAAATGHWARDPVLLPALLERAGQAIMAAAGAGRLGPRELLSVALGLAAARSCCTPPPRLVQTLAANVQRNPAGFCSGQAGQSPDDLARMLQALVRCAAAVEGGTAAGSEGSGPQTDPGVISRVERALEGAARKVVSNLPTTTPEGLTALAVAYATPVAPTTGGRDRAGAGADPRLPSRAQATSNNTSISEASADDAERSEEESEDADSAGPTNLIRASAAGLLPDAPMPTAPRLSRVRRAVLRATLRAALRRFASMRIRTPTSPNDTAPDGAAAPDGDAASDGAASPSGPVQLPFKVALGRRPDAPSQLPELVGTLSWCVRGMAAGGPGAGDTEAAEDLSAGSPAVQRVLPLCGPSELALLSVAYARAGCRPPALTTALSAAVRAAGPRLAPLDVANIAWAAAWGAQPNPNTSPDPTPSSDPSSDPSGGADGSPDAGAGPGAAAMGPRDAMLLAVLDWRATQLLAGGEWGPPGQELANLLWACAKLNHYSELLLEAVAEAVRSQGLGRMRPLEVAMLGAALGQLGFFDAGLMAMLAERAAADARGYTGRVLCWALSAFALLNCYHPALLRAATARTRQLLAQHRAALADGSVGPGDAGAGTLKPRPSAGGEGGQAELAAAAAPSQRRRGPEAASGVLTAFDIVTLLWCFGVLQHVDTECLEGLFSALPRDPRVFTVHDLARLGLAEAMLRGALSRRGGGAGGTKGRGSADAGAVAPPPPPTRVAAAGKAGAAAAWVPRLLPTELRAAVAEVVRPRRPRVSALQRDVRDALRAMGLQPRVEAACGIFSLDLCLNLPASWTWDPEQPPGQAPPTARQAGLAPWSGSKGPVADAAESGSGYGRDGRGRRTEPSDRTGLIRVAVEVDGPSHFAANVPNHALGPTVARDRCLQDMGLALLVVPGFEWATLKGRDAKKAYMARRLAAALAAASSGGAARGPRSAAAAAAPVFPNMVISQYVVKGSGVGHGNPSRAPDGSDGGRSAGALDGSNGGRSGSRRQE